MNAERTTRQDVLEPEEAERIQVREAARIAAEREERTFDKVVATKRRARILALLGFLIIMTAATIVGGLAVWAGKHFGIQETLIAGTIAIIATLIAVAFVGSAGADVRARYRD